MSLAHHSRISTAYFVLWSVIIAAFQVIQAEAANPTFTREATTLVSIRGGAMAWGDYDNDDDLDVFVIGDPQGAGQVSALYRNDGGSDFSRIPLTIPGYRSGSVAWGDYDNDGYLDLLLAGLGSPSAVYRNEGATNFVEIMQFGQHHNGTTSWGDINNDGKLDFAICGAGSNNRIYANSNGSTFVELITTMPSVYYGTVEWTDFNRDGTLDLLLTGHSNQSDTGGTYIFSNEETQFSQEWFAKSYTEPGFWIDVDNDGWPDISTARWSGQITEVYRNDRNGSFELTTTLPIGPTTVGDFNSDGWSDLLVNFQIFQNPGTNDSDTNLWPTVDASLPNLGSSPIVNRAFAGDFDNDGRMDLISSDSLYRCHIYRNTTLATNTPPSSPQRLHSVVNTTSVTLSWGPATDDQQAGGLTYNVRVGTSPGGHDVISPMSASNGFRRVVRAGNTGTLTNYLLTKLTGGTRYYWSVQSVDNSFAGSAFSSEGSFVATLAPPTMSSFTNIFITPNPTPLILPFTVIDDITPPGELIITATSSNPELLEDEINIRILGDTAQRALFITPKVGQLGTTTIMITATDEDGESTMEEFEFTVGPPNLPPTAADIEGATRSNQSLVIPTQKLLLFASDPDGGPLTVIEVSATSTNGGTGVLNDSSITYSPRPGYVGFDRLTYTISDGRGGSDSAHIFLRVRSASEVSANLIKADTSPSGSIRITFAGIPGRTYTVQRTTTIPGPWTNLTSIAVGPDGMVTLDDPDPPPAGAFYRTVYP